MSRNLLILTLLVSGTGCSSNRPLLSTIVVTPPRVSFRQPPPAETRKWTAVDVMYQSESLNPDACSPLSARPDELITFFEEEELPAPLPPSELLPSVTTASPVPTVTSPASPAVVHLEAATNRPSVHQFTPSVASPPSDFPAFAQASVSVTYMSGSLTPTPCTPSRVLPLELVTFFESDESTAPRPPLELDTEMTSVVPVSPADVPVFAPPAITHLDEATSPPSVDMAERLAASVPLEMTPPVPSISISTPPITPDRVESPTPTESDWKPATRISLASAVQTSTVLRSDQHETPVPEVRQVMPVDSLSPPVMVPPQFSELLTEIRNQRQLIEALQRDLTRERSADDAAMDELEAAVEDLLVLTKTPPIEMSATLQK